MTNYINLIQAGMSLVPIPHGTKGPKTKGWNLEKNCINQVTQAALLKGMNIGLAHAYCEPDPTSTLDIDNYKHARSLLASKGIDLNSYINAYDAVVIWSGKKYSLKLLYRLPPGEKPLETKKLLGPDGKSALEFRCATKDGLTVQDILPPSMHPDGHQYEWYGEGDPLNPPVIPSEILNFWKSIIAPQPSKPKKNNSKFLINNTRPETPRQIAILKKLLCFISADCDYEKWRDVVWAILSTDWNCAEDIAYEWSKTAPDRFDEDAFWLVANSYMADHTSAITVGTIYHFARFGGWNG